MGGVNKWLNEWQNELTSTVLFEIGTAITHIETTMITIAGFRTKNTNFIVLVRFNSNLKLNVNLIKFSSCVTAQSVFWPSQHFLAAAQLPSLSPDMLPWAEAAAAAAVNMSILSISSYSVWSSLERRYYRLYCPTARVQLNTVWSSLHTM